MKTLSKRQSISYIFIFIVILISCCKDNEEDLNNHCEDFPLEVLGHSYFVQKRFQFKSPYFNPNNSNEFVYNFFDYQENKFQLKTYNLTTNTHTLIQDEVKVMSQPKWSSKNWIAFDNHLQDSYQVSIVKSDGTEYQQITNNIYNLYPAWGNDGETLYWMNNITLSNVPNYFLRQQITSSTIDTMMRYTGDIYTGLARFNDISKNNNLLHASSCLYSGCLAKTNLDVWPLETESLTDDASILTHLVSLTWGENDNIVYYTTFKDGLYRLNITTGETSLLMDFCDSKFYKQISYSSDCHCIVGERVDSYIDWSLDNQIFENSSIYIIDLNTMQESEIISHY